MSVDLKGQVDDVLKGCVELLARSPIVTSLNVTENGTYTPPEGVDGYNEVNVNIPIPTYISDTLNVTENGTYTPPEGVDGYNEVNVAIIDPDTIGKFPTLPYYKQFYGNTDSGSSNVRMKYYGIIPQDATIDNFKLSLERYRFVGTSGYTSNTSIASLDKSTNEILLNWGGQSGTTRQWFKIVYIDDLTKYHYLNEWTTLNSDNTTLSVEIPSELNGASVDKFIVEFKDITSGGTNTQIEYDVEKTIEDGILTITAHFTANTNEGMKLRIGCYY